MNWISLKENDPPFEHWVLVTSDRDPEGIIYEAQAHHVTEWSNKSRDLWWRIRLDPQRYWTPTHWRPKPIPPQPESK